LWFHGRVPWGGDAIWNTVGVALGVVAARVGAQLISLPRYAGDRAQALHLLVALGLVVIKLAPFAPSFDFGEIKNSLKPLLVHPGVEPFWVFHNAAYWLAVFLLLGAAQLHLGPLRALALALGTLGARVFIVTATLSLSHVIGALLAIGIWFGTGRRLPPLLITILFAAAVLGYGLEPFILRSTPTDFHWLPFHGGMHGNMIINVAALLKKSVMYGAVVWLLSSQGMRLSVATLATAGAVLVSEYGQRFLVDSVPEITDSLLTLAAGIAIALLRSRSSTAGKTLASTTRIEQETSAARSPTRRAPWLIGTAAVLGVSVAVAVYLPSRHPVLIQAPWAGEKHSVIFDHHTHTTYSDGSLSPRELVQLARRGGCDALAITDHSDSRKSLTLEKLSRIDQLRIENPNMLILAGVELDMPSYEGREHVNIIANPSAERSLLIGLMDMIYSEQAMDARQLDARLLGVLGHGTEQEWGGFAIYNHPSRKDEERRENLEDYRRWYAATPKLIGLAGAPGHQRSMTTGSYRRIFLTQHRWDPAITTVGGTWDQLLEEGYPAWGAIASSDYHGKLMDYPPCAFSRIHVAVPTRDYNGLIRALRAGTFWADHGLLLKELSLRLDISGLGTPLFPGAEATVPKEELIGAITLSLERGPAGRGHSLRYDLISSCGSGSTTLLDSGYLPPDRNHLETAMLINHETGASRCHLRARIIKETLGSEELAAYTNPIRLLLR
jgi:hypothetical protein